MRSNFSSDGGSHEQVALVPTIFLAFLLAPFSWAFAGEDAAAHLKWSFNGETFNLNPQFAKEDCEYYRNRPHPQTGDYSVYATDRVDDRYITDLAEQFRQWMNHMNLSDLERVNFVAAFAQSLAGVASDAVASADATPRYPLETLIDKKGDCEDTAILAATILQELDYEVALIRLGKHMGLGVVCNHCNGEYFYENGIEYLYLETAAQGWELGQIPPQV